MNVLAGWLPGAAQSVAAISVAFSLYGILFMGFAAFGMAASTRVGNALGAGREQAARLAALASAVVAPAIWLVVACVLTWPVTQNWLLGLFTTGTDPLLLQVRRLGAGRPQVLGRGRMPRLTPWPGLAVAPEPPAPPAMHPHAQHMRSLLYLVVLLELFDGAQVGAG